MIVEISGLKAMLIPLLYSPRFFAASEIAMLAMRKGSIEPWSKRHCVRPALARLKAISRSLPRTYNRRHRVRSSPPRRGAAAIGYIKHLLRLALHSDNPLGDALPDLVVLPMLIFRWFRRNRAKSLALRFRAHRLLRCPPD